MRFRIIFLALCLSLSTISKSTWSNKLDLFVAPVIGFVMVTLSNIDDIPLFLRGVGHGADLGVALCSFNSINWPTALEPDYERAFQEGDHAAVVGFYSGINISSGLASLLLTHFSLLFLKCGYGTSTIESVARVLKMLQAGTMIMVILRLFKSQIDTNSFVMKGEEDAFNTLKRLSEALGISESAYSGMQPHQQYCITLDNRSEHEIGGFINVINSTDFTEIASQKFVVEPSGGIMTGAFAAEQADHFGHLIVYSKKPEIFTHLLRVDLCLGLTFDGQKLEIKNVRRESVITDA